MHLFLARAAKKCPKNMPAKFQGCAFFVPGVFPKRRSLNDDGQTFFFPGRSLSLVALLRITCCWYGFMACPRDSMAIQLLAAQRLGHLSLSPRRGPAHDRDVGVHTGRKSMILTSKSSSDVISRDLFLCDSSLFSFERTNEKIQYLSKPNQTSTLFLPTCEK